VCTNLAEAWQMKEDRSIFIGKLSDAAQAASKTQNCLEFATKYNYIDNISFQRLDSKYEDIFALICNRATIKSQNII
jgi:four helix bundle protein